MPKPIHYLSYALLASILLLYGPLAHAQVGAPVGGSTGTSGNAGVGDYDAGTDRSDTYDTPANAIKPTTSGARHHGHRAAGDSVDPNTQQNSNYTNPVETYSNPSGAPIAPVPGAGGPGR